MRIILPALLCTLVMSSGSALSEPALHYHLAQEVAIPGDDGWDYLTFDGTAGRLFITHGTRVQVVDGSQLRLTGEIDETPGVHGVAIADDLGRGYITAGRANSLIVFDLKSLAVVARIPTSGEGPDSLAYESKTHRVFTFNGRGRNASVIDTAKNAVVGTIALDAKPEAAESDGAGHVFVNLEDKNSIAAIDAEHMTVAAVWPLTGCDGPSAMALDVAAHRLFCACDKVMAVVDTTSGKQIATLAIGDGIDAAAFDPATHLAFASGGDGTVTAVREITPDKYAVVQTIRTKSGARTMALDPRTHRLFLVTAKLGPRPAPTAEQPHPRAPIEPRSFELLVLNP